MIIFLSATCVKDEVTFFIQMTSLRRVSSGLCNLCFAYVYHV